MKRNIFMILHGMKSPAIFQFPWAFKMSTGYTLKPCMAGMLLPGLKSAKQTILFMLLFLVTHGVFGQEKETWVKEIRAIYQEIHTYLNTYDTVKMNL